MSNTLLLVVMGALGAIVGSFLNVVIYRLPRPGLTITRPRRSFCPNCGAAIRWHDNIPIVSYFILGGRCRSCRQPLALRYLVVEAATAALFLLLVVAHPPAESEALGGGSAARLGLLLVYLWVLSAAVAITGIDWDFKIIPDQITLPLAVGLPFACALLPASQGSACGWVFRQLLDAGLHPSLAAYTSSVGGELVGIFFLWGLVVLFSWILRKQAMGLGDVKYLGVIGGLCGPERALAAFGVACVVGAVVGVPVRLLRGDREIPFGPFLSVGLTLMILAGEPVVDFMLHWPERVA
ncbi:MAG: prepilin peptidase [Planctomycetota bacterium]